MLNRGRNIEKGRVITRRMFILAAAKILLFAGISSRLYNLQISDREKYEILSDKNRIREWKTPPQRGIIVDKQIVKELNSDAMTNFVSFWIKSLRSLVQHGNFKSFSSWCSSNKKSPQIEEILVQIQASIDCIAHFFGQSGPQSNTSSYVNTLVCNTVLSVLSLSLHHFVCRALEEFVVCSASVQRRKSKR